MGVCAQQHRITTGRYNYITYNVCNNICRSEDGMSVAKAFMIYISVVGLILYMYIWCLLVALFIEISLNQRQCFSSLGSLHAVLGTNTKIYITNGLRELLNLCLLLLMYTTKKQIICMFNMTELFDQSRNICKKRLLTLIKLPVSVKYTI